ncbi:MAG: FHA domain-containing protein [Ruminiclostridium sp.]
MEMKQCASGHFYDASKNQQCPYCAGGSDIGVTRPLGNESGMYRTTPVTYAEAPAFPKTAPISSAASYVNNIPPTMPINNPETNKTVALQINDQGIDPVRGWFVCVNGKKKGKDFRIHSEKNFIGRSKSNDICMDFDETVSRECSAIATYDVRTNKFWIQSGDGKSNIYLNDNIILVPVELNNNDVLTVGQTELMFMSFCNSSFKW